LTTTKTNLSGNRNKTYSIKENNMKILKNLESCRICNSPELTEVIKIKDQYLSPTFVKTNEGNPLANIKVPQTLVLCENCTLLQLKETVNPDLLYKQYFYRSAVSDTMRKDLASVVQDVMSRVTLQDEDYVLDIGANDCTMISFFPENLNRCGIEPAENISWSKVDKSIKIVNNYFNNESVKKASCNNKIKIFTSCAMFYDLDDPNSFVKTVKDNLHMEGVFCIQLSYLPAMLRNMNFYDICNEHLEYYSLNTLQTLMNRHNLEVYDAEENDVNGGSIRVMITHTASSKRHTDRFQRLKQTEKEMNLNKKETYTSFYEKILDMKNKIRNIFDEATNSGNLILGLGASTKGNMLLQMFDIGKEILPFISERNPDKVGLRTLGTDIELISEQAARDLNPSHMLVLPWYFKEEIVEREREFLETGGALLIPMPYPHIIDKNGERAL
jgi:hypothetical protein